MSKVFFMALGRSGFRHGSGEARKILQKGCFYIVVSQGNSENKVEKWYFFIWSQIIVLSFVYSMFLVDKGTISWLSSSFLWVHHLKQILRIIRNWGREKVCVCGRGGGYSPLSPQLRGTCRCYGAEYYQYISHIEIWSYLSIC